MYLQQSKLNTRKRNRMTQFSHFETVIFKDFFSFIDFTFVTRK